MTNSGGQTWDVKNVLVADGAVFASNADKNPTLTIMALAWRGRPTACWMRCAAGNI